MLVLSWTLLEADKIFTAIRVVNQGVGPHLDRLLHSGTSFDRVIQ